MSAASSDDEKKPSDSLEKSGARLAALWLLSVQPEVAVKVLHELDDKDVRLVAQASADLDMVLPKKLLDVHRQFRKDFEDSPIFLRGNIGYLSDLTEKAFGEPKAMKLLGPVPDPEPIEEEPEGPTLAVFDAGLLANVLKDEHPQVIAAILVNLPASQSGELLNELPEELRGQVVGRITTLKTVPKEALTKAEISLAAGLPMPEEDEVELDGYKAAASVLNALDQEESDAILAGIAETDEEAATEIRKAMFTFADLEALDRRNMQSLLKEVPNDQLLIGLKTASEGLKELIFSSVSQRAAKMLMDDLEVMGPMRVSEVEEAQAVVVEVALRMLAEGTITISGKGEEMV